MGSCSRRINCFQDPHCLVLRSTLTTCALAIDSCARVPFMSANPPSKEGVRPLLLQADSVFVHTCRLQEKSGGRACLKTTVILIKLCVHTIGLDTTLLLPCNIIFTCELGKPPLAGGDNLLTTRKLKLRAAEGLNSLHTMHVLGSDGKHDLTDGDTRRSPLYLAKCTAHTSLETIRAGTGKHLVDAQAVKGVKPHAEVKLVLASVLYHVLVGRDPSSLHCF